MRGKRKRFTQSDREYIERALKKKQSIAQIASFLDCSKQAIYYEIKKGRTQQLDSRTWELKEVYLSDVAQQKTRKNFKNCGPMKKLDATAPELAELKDLIKDKKYSPEAALQLSHSKKICTKTLYNYVHAGYIKDLTLNDLPYAKPKKKKQHKQAKRVQKPKEKLIENRPADIADRETYGHWEMDTVYSSKDDKSCLLVLSERMSREEIIIQMADRTMKSVIKGLNWLERKLGAKRFRETFKTITCDNGVEFSDWEAMEKSNINRKTKRTEIYYCHAYSSYERGTNENINRMIRRWIPKGDDIGLYSKKEIAKIMEWINNYPRKIFGGMSTNSYKKLLGLDDIMQWLL